MEVKVHKGECTEGVEQSEEEMGMRKGPWRVEEDTILINYVATHGDCRWNSLARSAGLKRSGKSCRLRWLNYLRPDVRRGNITLQEQISILDLHSRWGNRWSKIAQHLPGRTDNEIKNYWRTRVIKQAKQLKCDVNSKKFRDALRYMWMPPLLERVQPTSQMDPINPSQSASASAAQVHVHHHQHGLHTSGSGTSWLNKTNSSCGSGISSDSLLSVAFQQVHSDSGPSACSEHLGHNVSVHSIGDDPGICPSFNIEKFEYTNLPSGVGGGDLLLESLWNDENLWVLPRLRDDIGIKDNFLA